MPPNSGGGLRRQSPGRPNSSVDSDDRTHKKSTKTGMSRTKMQTNLSCSEIQNDVKARMNLSLSREGSHDSREEHSPRNAVPEPTITLSSIAIESLTLKTQKRMKRLLFREWKVAAKEEKKSLEGFIRKRLVRKGFEALELVRRVHAQDKKRDVVGFTFYKIRLFSKALYCFVILM